MIPGTNPAVLDPAAALRELESPDPAHQSLAAEVRHARNTLARLISSLDPKATPQGVADALHDSLDNLKDASSLMEALTWGWAQ